VSEPTVSVKQGCVWVESVRLVSRGDAALVFHVDMRAKYAEVDALEGMTVHLGTSDRTIHREPSSESTEITIDPGVPGEWEIEGMRFGRYAILIVAYLHNIPGTGTECFNAGPRS